MFELQCTSNYVKYFLLVRKDVLGCLVFQESYIFGMSLASHVMVASGIVCAVHWAWGASVAVVGEFWGEWGKEKGNMEKRHLYGT